MTLSWHEVVPNVFQFGDSCNVYGIAGPEGSLIVNAGTGLWLQHLQDLPKPPVALCLTHYFRDHAAGALAAAQAGIPVYVPVGEKAILADPVQHFRERETYIIYDNLWDLFAPIEGVPITGVLHDYEQLQLAELDLEILPLPGVTLTQIGIAIELPLPDGKLKEGKLKVVCCGEAIHSPGKLARVAPLQYNYNDLSGAVNVVSSARRLRDYKPDILLPSLGQPILQDTDLALAQLEESMRFLVAGRGGMTQQLNKLGPDPLEKVTEHVWRTTQSQSVNWFLISESGKALAIDYGYDVNNIVSTNYPRPANRRPLLHSLPALRERFGIEHIDVVLVSHFHDDHVCGIPLLQRLFGTECWAAENFADLLMEPQAHCFPCNWPMPIQVQRRLPLDQTFTWEEYTFCLHPMSGHTRFASLIGFEADGKRFAHTGDQYFFAHGWGQEPLLPFDQNPRVQNHVYRNGALLDGYAQSGQWLLNWHPDIVLQGHQQPFFTDGHFFEQIKEWTREYQETHQRAMLLGAEDTHFNLDSWGGWIWPYRTYTPVPKPISVRVTVRNPYPHQADLLVKLVGPTGWQGTTATLSAAPRAEVATSLEITPNGPCRRQPFAVELVANGQPFGQVAEALLTVGGEMF
ncbi:MAG: MBL fold metallo-hydrolase [Abitibacteriaceae bacterium]|nr:MBL fold metallo-hydrolase [Abditibacteriaceae bacterium]MBV9867596.1 MBL fold metallo-hydrolase [Abditibacteriaceae bacterium]